MKTFLLIWLCVVMCVVAVLGIIWGLCMLPWWVAAIFMVVLVSGLMTWGIYAEIY